MSRLYQCRALSSSSPTSWRDVLKNRHGYRRFLTAVDSWYATEAEKTFNSILILFKFVDKNRPKFYEDLATGEQGQNFIKTILSASGYTVIPYGIEHHIVELKKELKGLYNTGTQRRLHHMPDFVVIDPESKDVWLVEVKNKSIMTNYLQETEIYLKYHNVKDIIDLWNDSVITITMPVEPYCICVAAKEIDWNIDYNGKAPGKFPGEAGQDKWNFHRIQKPLHEVFPKVKPELLEKYANLIAPPKRN